MADEAAWGGLRLEVPPPVLEPIITAINNFLEMLVVFLDIVLVVLDIVKVFIVGLLNPLLAVLDALIALIESLANDLRKAGLYIHTDTYSGGGKTGVQHYEALKGGFSNWETRCFNWLIDTTDRNRPDFSTGSGVLGLFFYASVDYDEILRAIKMVQSILRLFGDQTDTPLNTPNNLKHEFKKFGGAFGLTRVGKTKMYSGEEGVPEIAGISWGFSPSPLGPLGVALPALPPDASVIEISTTPDGYMVGTTRQQAGTDDPKKVSNSFVEAPLDVGGGPLRIYGGTDALLNTPYSVTDLPPKVWFVKNPDDMNPLFLSKWVMAESENGGKAIGQAQIVIHHGSLMNAFFPDFSYDLKWEDCPYGIKEIVNGKPLPTSEPAREVYVRISAANDSVKKKVGGALEKASGNEGFSYYQIENLESPTGRVYAKHPTNYRRSPPSAPMKIKFPSDAQKTFLQMMRNAACIAYLCRGDLDTEALLGDGKPTGFLPLAKKLSVYMPGGYGAYTKEKPFYTSRKKIATAARRLAEDFENRVGHIPESVLELLVEQHAENLNFPFQDDKTAKSGFDPLSKPLKGVSGTTEDIDLYTHCTGKNRLGNALGVHINLKSAAKKPAEIKALLKGFPLTVTTASYPLADDQLGFAGAQFPIVIYHEGSTTPGNSVSEGDKWGYAYARDLFSTAQVQSALTMLQIATNLNDGTSSWIAIRPFDTLLAPFEDLMETWLAFLKNVREGLMAIIKQILDYIRMIEARIVELQQLIRRIQALLAMFADFVISADLHMLVVSGAGTQGLIGEFMNAQEKPTDGPDAYGTGVAVVAGGLPLVIVDLLKAIFAAGDKPGGGASDEDANAAALLEDGA